MKSLEDFAAAFAVSRETKERLAAFDASFLDWSSRHNLVARSTIDDRWERHYADSAQLFEHLAGCDGSLVDIGSGAGFPGLILAAMGRGDGLKVSLVESVGKKAAFLNAAAKAMDLDNVTVIPQRVESITISPPDFISARALASLDKLCRYAHEIAGKNTICIFPKGQDVGSELTEAAKCWHMDVKKTPSMTNPESSILLISNLAPRKG